MSVAITHLLRLPRSQEFLTNGNDNGRRSVLRLCARRRYAVAEEVPLTDPELDGNRLTWSQSITKPLRLHLQFDVLVEGDEMTGKSTAGRLPSSKVSGRGSVPDR
ncbi:hypothetical protein [Rhodococcus sp. WB9]|uniref:hypothetical protein n=1 Tax=Rhodococcus sp. WB9 TaxID=2594007 RepID=UPI0021B24752|nr:hypothetical protein [Rhodococcus sp. WB9]